MKRIYIKPEIRTLQFHLKAFITAGSGPGGQTGYGINTSGSEGGSEDPITEPGSDPNDRPSRYLRESLWDDIE